MKIIISENIKKKLIEELAELEHDQWSHWTKYMIDNLTSDNIKNWERQIKTNYKDLTKKEKDSDREWAEKAYKIIKEYLK